MDQNDKTARVGADALMWLEPSYSQEGLEPRGAQLLGSHEKGLEAGGAQLLRRSSEEF